MKKSLLLYFFFTLATSASHSQPPQPPNTSGAHPPTIEGKAANRADIGEKARQSLGETFYNYGIFEINSAALARLLQNAPEGQNLRLALGNEHDWNLTLHPNDIRGENYVALEGLASGTRRLDPGPNVTYAGFLNGNGGGDVRLTVDKGFLFGIVIQNGVQYYIEPLSRFERENAFDKYLVYAADEVVPNPNLHCGVSDTEAQKQRLREQVRNQQQYRMPTNGASECLDVEIATAADFSMYQSKGSSVAATNNYITGVFNNCQLDYNQFNIRFLITTQFVYTGGATNNPWAQSNNTTDPSISASLLLGEFRSWGNGNGFGTTDYALASLWTDKNIDNGVRPFSDPDYSTSVVGLAYTDVICESGRYQLIEDFSSNATFTRVLVSHETGHNFSCPHNYEFDSTCDPPGRSSLIMDPSVSSATCWSDGAGACEANSIMSIRDHIASRSCLQPIVDAGEGVAIESCTSETDAINLIDYVYGGDAGGTWTVNGGGSTPTSGFVGGTTGTFVPNGNAAGTYLFDYTLSGPNLSPDNCTGAATPGNSCEGMATVTVVLVELNAGTPVATMPTVCSNSSTAINLGSLLTGEDSGGDWTETSGVPSTGGAFSAAAGTFNPSGQAADTYTFQYAVATSGSPSLPDLNCTYNFQNPLLNDAFGLGYNVARENTGVMPCDPAGRPEHQTFTITIDVTTYTGTAGNMNLDIRETGCGLANNLFVSGLPGVGTYAYDEQEISFDPRNGLCVLVYDPTGDLTTDIDFDLDVVISYPGLNGIAPCEETGTVSVEVIDCCDASFTVNATASTNVPVFPTASFCNNAANPSVTVTGDAGGTFAAAPGGLSFNPSTGAINLAASTPGTYLFTYSSPNTCDESIQVEIDEPLTAGNALPAATTCNGGGASTVNLFDLLNGEDGGGTWLETSGVPSGNGITAGNMYNPNGDNPGTYTFEYTVDGGACGNDSEMVTVNVSDLPDAEFSYPSASYCVTGSADPSPTHATGADGTYSSTAGLAINPATGTIDLSASTPGSYTVTNTFTVSGCPTDTHTFNVTITPPPDAEFAYPQTVFCSSGSDPAPTHATGTDGTYSSTAGLSINPANGVIDLSASTNGSYTVTNTVSATGCANDSHTFGIQIVTQPDAEFSYPSASYCVTGSADPSPTHATGADGTYSSTAGLAINPATGTIDLSASTPGSYTVTNTLTVSGCPTDTHTFNVTITPPPDAEFTYPQTVFCTSGSDPSPTHNTGTDGTYSSTAGLSINPANGVIDLSASTNGSYTVTNTVSATGCANDSHTFGIQIVTQPDAEFSYPSASYCVTGPADPSPTHATGADGTYSSTAGLAINPATGTIDLSASTPGSYTVTNTLTVSGCPTDTHTFNVTITPPLNPGSALPPIEVCNIPTAPTVTLGDLLSGEDAGGMWSETSASPSTGGAFDAGSGTFSPVGQAAGTYTFEYLVSNGGICSDETETVTIIIRPQCCPNLTSFGASPLNVCDGETVQFALVLDAGSLQESVDYRVSWSGPSGNANTGNEGISMSYMGADNCTETQTYTLEVYCINSGQTVISETVDVTVSPPINATPIDEGECVVSISPACASWPVVWDDGQGNTGTGNTYDGNAYGTQTGTVVFTVSNPDGAANCASDAFPVDFECCIADAGVLTLASDALCPGDDIVASTGGSHQMDTNYTHAYLLVEAASGAIVDMNTSGTFSGMAANIDYIVYSYSQSLTLPPAPVASVGIAIGDIGSQNMGCFDLDGSGMVFYPDDFAVSESVNTTQTSPYLYNSSQITVTGGTPPYNYDWVTSGYVRYAIPSLGIVNVIYDNPALWTLSVTDANGCNTSEMVFGNNIPGMVALNITNYNVTPDTGGGTGTVDITVAGGSGVGTYSFGWTSATYPAYSGATEDLGNLQSGWYVVTVTDQSVPQQTAVGAYWVPYASGGSTSGGFVRNKMATNGCFVAAVPNPTATTATLNFAVLQDDVATIEIFDISGRVAASFGSLKLDANSLQSLAIPTSELGGAGIYMVRLTTEKGFAATVRLVVLSDGW